MTHLSRAVQNTKWAIEKPPKREEPSTEDAAKGGLEYLQFYNTVEFIRALITLMGNSDNQEAIRVLMSINQKIEAWNIDRNHAKNRGTFRIDKLSEMYRRA